MNSQSQRFRSMSWLLSFGDLLTLLLTFFIAVMALTPQTTPRTAQLAGITEKDNGTAFALSIVESQDYADGRDLMHSKRLVARWSEVDLIPGTTELRHERLNELNSRLTEAGYQVQAVTIEVCGMKLSGDSEQLGHSSLSLALSLRRQFVDSYPKADPVRLALRGSSCAVNVTTGGKLVASSYFDLTGKR